MIWSIVHILSKKTTIVIVCVLIGCIGHGVYAQAMLPYWWSYSFEPAVTDPSPSTFTPATNPSTNTNGYQFGEWWFRWQTTLFNPDVPDSEEFGANVANSGWVNSLLLTIKTAVNRVLGLLAFIALLFLLYWGFKILIAGTDDKAVSDAVKIVKNAAYGILFIALSWIIVTFIFYIAAVLTEDTPANNTVDSIVNSHGDPVHTAVPYWL